MAQLPVFTGKSWESFTSWWSTLKQQESWTQLEMGATIHALRREFGSSAVEKFAWEMGEASIPTLNEYARVYRRIAGLEDDARASILDALENGMLFYAHVRDAHHKLKDDEEFVAVLEQAQDEGWRTRRLKIEIARMTEQRGVVEDGPRLEPPDREEFHFGEAAGPDIMSSLAEGLRRPWEEGASPGWANASGTMMIQPSSMGTMQMHEGMHVEAKLAHTASLVWDACYAVETTPSRDHLDVVRAMKERLERTLAVLEERA